MFGRRLAHVNVPAALVLFFVIVSLAGLFPSSGLGAEAGGQPAGGAGTFLADRHGAAGIDCTGCHNESPPKAAPDTRVCLSCHGPNDKLAEKTADLEANPHASHLGDLDCGNCHHGHNASVDYCGRCHTFGFKVP
jgi:fumarate reductase flavoprotein subunit